MSGRTKKKVRDMILITAYIVIFFAMLQLAAAMANLIFRPSLTKADKSSNEQVSVLIPARNEETNIVNILGDLIKQKYTNIEIIVYNDQSEDKTGEAVRRFSEIDNRIRLINSESLPEGWLGKNYACHSLSKEAKGRYLMFLDADVRLGEDIISRTVTHLKKYRLSLVSIFPKQILVRPGEKITVPVMNYILLTLLPLALVRRTQNSSVAAANGQFMLFDTGIYQKLQPHEKFKGNKVEDIAIARYYKSNSLYIDCLTGDETIRCRMYNGFREAITGFSKNITAFFGNSFELAIIFWAITTFGFLFVLYGMQEKIFVLYLVIYFLTRAIVSVISRQSIINNILLAIPQQISIGVFIYRAIMNRVKNYYVWKGRRLS